MKFYKAHTKYGMQFGLTIDWDDNLGMGDEIIIALHFAYWTVGVNIERKRK